MDHLKIANEQVCMLDRAFNIDIAIDALSIRPTISLLALTFKVNVTLNVETIRYTSRQNKINNILISLKQEIIYKFLLVYIIIQS
jgi:hypothetical protein